MSFRARSPLLALAFLPLLGACVDDAASWQIELNDHALTLIRNQRWFWSGQVELTVVAARLPDCQRRHSLVSAPAGEATVDVFLAGANEYLLKQGGRYYLVETRTCAGFQKLEREPSQGLGTKVGTFREKDGRLRFVPEARG